MTQPAKNGELIKVPNTLRIKIGGRMAKVDKEAVAKAEAALASLSSNFDDWIATEVAKLETAHKRVSSGKLCGPEGRELFNAAHDLKGLGTTYGFPIVTEMAASLCDITLNQNIREKAPIALINAHVNAIRAAVTGGIKTIDHPIGGTLSIELKKKSTEFLDTL